MQSLLPDNTLQIRLRQRLEAIRQQGLLRTLQQVRAEAHGRIRINEKLLLNLAGNDYLGLGSDSQLICSFYADLAEKNCLELYAPGSGASRLMTGNHCGYRELEQAMAELYGTEKVLLFNSGYHLNIGLLPVLAEKGDLILADKLCHASLIDGMRLSRARVIRYPHLDYDRIEALLKKHRDRYHNIFLISESIFSMDGDCVDTSILVRFKERYGIVLYLDEAHAVGVRGQQGRGLAEEQGTLGHIDLLAGTFGKAWAGQGAFVACNRIIHDFLVNTSRSLIFTTALPPVNVHWLNTVLTRIIAMTRERKHLSECSQALRGEVRRQGLTTSGDSQIVPVIIGAAEQAVAVAGHLTEHGFLVNAVRPPTVPAGTSRLRLSVTAAMDERQLNDLPGIIAEVLSLSHCNDCRSC